MRPLSSMNPQNTVLALLAVFMLFGVACAEDTTSASRATVISNTSSDGTGITDDTSAPQTDPESDTATDQEVGTETDADAGPETELEPDAPEAPADRDNDGVPDDDDAFPDDPSEDTDSDGDNVGDNSDAFPNDRNESSDRDNDGVGDNRDAFPDDPNETNDHDNDGIGDNSDEDDDNDGLSDIEEQTHGQDCVLSSPVLADSDDDGTDDPLDIYPRDPFPEFLLRANDRGSIDLFLSNRDGTFQDGIEIGEPIEHDGRQLNYTAFEIGDFDGNGRTDFIAHSDVLNSNSPERNFYFFVRDEKEDEFRQYFIGVTDRIIAGIITDVDGDFGYDIVRFEPIRSGNIISGAYQIYRGRGSAMATCVYSEDPGDQCFFWRQDPVDVTSVVSQQWIARSARQAVSFNPNADDFNDLTLITYPNGGNAPTSVYTLFGDGEGGFQAPVLRFTHNANGQQAPANTVLFADFNNDSIGDITLGFDDDGRPGEAWTYLGVGDGTFEQNPQLALDINPTDTNEQGGGESLGREGSGRTFDFDFDGNADLLIGVKHVAYDQPGQTRLYRGNGDGTFSPEFVVIGPDSAFNGRFQIPQRLCPTYNILGD